MTIGSNKCSLLVGLWLAACGADTVQDSPAETTKDSKSDTLLLFPGSGTSGAGEALGAEIPPDTAHECVAVGAGSAVPASAATMTCYFNEDDDTTLAAFVERRLEVINDTNWVHIRLTFNPNFVDNTYGQNAIGWGGTEVAAAVVPAPMAREPLDAKGKAPKPMAKPPKGKGGHTFKDLLGSDHAEFKLFTDSGDLAMHFKLDYISEGAETSSGYGSLGVDGGDGKLIVGKPEWILGATSSLDRNLNGCGYESYTTDSPATDENYTPSDEAPEWDYRVVYEVWVAEAALGGDALDNVVIEYVHASPSKAASTQIVTEGPCPPPTEEPPAAPPSTSLPPSDPPETTPPADESDAGVPGADAGTPSAPTAVVR